MRSKYGCVFGLTAALALISAAAWADSLPAAIRSCVSETDATRRLACFDREVARYPDQTPTASAAPPTATGAAIAPGPSAKISSLKESIRRTAKVIKVEGPQDGVVLHLDNGETWEQVREATAAMSFRVGDTVNIDKSQGSFWIGARSGGVMMVRQRE